MRPNNNSRPLFITGIPRCGSSWVGEILGGCKQARYVYEPFNFHWTPSLQGQVRHFKYIESQSDIPPLLQLTANDALEGKQNWKQLGRAVYRGYLRSACRKADRVVIKDPTACLMTDWIARQFQAQILIVMRHPCGFASSMGSLDWPLNVNVLLGQKELMHDHLEPFRDTLRQARNDKWLTRGAFWGALHTVFAHQLDHNPDWVLLKYENLCADPAGQFETLAEKFGLELAAGSRQKIEALSTTDSTDSGSTRRNSQAMPEIWRQRMSSGEIDAVLGIVSEFKLDYYV